MVDRAAALGQRRVMFTPTLYFLDREPRPSGTPEEHSRVSFFCYARDSWGGCPPATLAQRAYFTESMKACLGRAVQRGLDIAIAPHVDDGALGGRWRQGLVFDPLAKFGARHGGADLSYDEFILQPLTTAVAAVVAPTTKVWFATQGVSLTFVRNVFFFFFFFFILLLLFCFLLFVFLFYVFHLPLPLTHLSQINKKRKLYYPPTNRRWARRSSTSRRRTRGSSR